MATISKIVSKVRVTTASDETKKLLASFGSCTFDDEIPQPFTSLDVIEVIYTPPIKIESLLHFAKTIKATSCVF